MSFIDTEEEKIKKNKRQPKINRKYIAPEKLEAVPLMSDVVALDDVTSSIVSNPVTPLLPKKSRLSIEREKAKIDRLASIFALAVRCEHPLDGETQAKMRRSLEVFDKQLSPSSFNEEPNDKGQ